MEEKSKKGAGSFYVPKEAINRLLGTGEKAKWLIPAYLKIAAHTDESGIYSTAGHSSIRRTLRRNKDDSIGFVEQLTKMKLVYTTKQWTKKTGETFPDDVPEKRKVRHVLNDFGEDVQEMVWFGRGLVDGMGEFNNPLRMLADCGAPASRLLLYLHQEYDPLNFHACNPLTTIYHKYAPANGQVATNYIIKGWQPHGEYMQGRILSHVFPDKEKWSKLTDEASWQEKNTHWEAFHNLEAAGFIYEVAAVVSTPVKVKEFESEQGEHVHTEWDYTDMENMGMVYALANLDRFASTTGELHEGVREAYRRLLVDDYKPNHVYSILPTGVNHSVMGLFRLRFSVDNRRNAFVSEALENQDNDRATAMKWLHHFRITKGLDNQTDGLH